LPSSIVNAAAITSGGPTQDFTSAALNGKTPTGCFVTVTRGTALGNDVAGGILSHGASDFTNTWCVGTGAEDNVAIGSVPDSSHVESTTEIVQLFAVTATVVDGAATVAAIAGGIRLTWTNFPSTAVQVIVRLIYDEDFAVGSLACSTTLDDTAPVSGLDFEPTAIEFASVKDAVGSGVGSHGVLSLGSGAFNADGSLNGQWAVTHFDADNPTTQTHVGKIARVGAVSEHLTVNAATGAASSDAYYELTSRTSDGFVLTTRGGGGHAHTVFWAARKAGNLRAWASLEIVDTSATGNKTVTPGFPPGEIVVVPTITDGANIDTVVATESSSIGIGADCLDGTAKCTAASVEDGANPSDTYSVTSNAFAALGVVGATDWNATVTARGDTTFTFNVSKASVLGLDALVGFLVIEAGKQPARRTVTGSRGAEPVPHPPGHGTPGGARHATTLAQPAPLQPAPAPRPPAAKVAHGGVAARQSAPHGPGPHPAASAQPHPARARASPTGRFVQNVAAAVIREMTRFRLARLVRLRWRPLPLPPEDTAPDPIGQENVLKGRISAPGLVRGRIVEGGL